MRLPGFLAALSAFAVSLPAAAETPAQLRDAFVLEAKAVNPAFAGPSAGRGRDFFSALHGREEKWFRRNCNDVAGRACTAQERADVLAWLLAAK